MKISFHKSQHPLLKKIVRHFAFQSLDGTGNANQWMTLFPNCTTNLCITLDSDLVSNNAGLMNNTISTSCIRPVTFSRLKTIEMAVIQLEPYGFHLLTGLPMQKYKNRFFQLDDFFSALVLENLYQRLYDASEDVLKIKILEEFVLAQITTQAVDDRILFATHQIQQKPDTQLDDLMLHLNLSARRIRDLFALHIGISPKYYLRLSRFNHTTNEVSRNNYKSLTEIALAKGYFDQAHFIKEFKEFGGLSPNQFRKLTEKSADFYNFEQ